MVKWSNPRNGVAHTHGVVAIEKGAFTYFKSFDWNISSHRRHLMCLVDLWLLVHWHIVHCFTVWFESCTDEHRIQKIDGSRKFFSGCKNLDDQARSSKPETADSKFVPKDTETNLVNNTRKVSGQYDLKDAQMNMQNNLI